MSPRRSLLVMRRVGDWVVALWVGSAAVVAYEALVHPLFGVLTGAAAVTFTVGSVLLFAATTSFVVSRLAVDQPRARRSRTTG
jgi:membrane-bound ClpP family serine protease